MRILKDHALPIQIEGLPYIFAGLLLVASSLVIWRGLASESEGFLLSPALATVFFTLFTVFSVWFYRNPPREIPKDDQKAVLSPADGRVLYVREADGKKIGAAKAKKIAIFMSPMDGHVNRAPIAGKIAAIEYTKGKFFKADLDKASEENEHNWVVMQSDIGPKIAFVQIAGFIARRIVCYVQPGERLSRGERYGMIRFGSRMEIVVPADSDVLVKEGDRTVAGETKIARLKSDS